MMEKRQTGQHLGRLLFFLVALVGLVLVALGAGTGATMASPEAQVSGGATHASIEPDICTLTITGEVELSDPSQLGRLVTLLTASRCNDPRNCPGVLDNLPRHYDAYTLVNPSPNPVCVTVDLDPLVTGGILQSAAYLGSFDPLSLCSNYVADIGPVPGLLGGDYSFTVPAGGTYVVVVNELVPNAGTFPYRLQITTDPNCQLTATATSTPNVGATQTAVSRTQTSVSGTQTANAGTATAVPTNTPTRTAQPTNTPCPVYGDISPSDGSQLGRLNSLLRSSTCADPRNCPGAFDNLPRHYDAYTYRNNTNAEVCITVNVTNSCLNEVLLQSAAYLGTFDPLNLCANYLADIGPSVLGISAYSFNVPANSNYVVVVSELVPNLGCNDYRLSVFGPQGGICPLSPTPTPNSGTRTAVAGGTQTAIVGATQTANWRGTQTSVAATQTASSGSATATSTSCPFQFSDVPPGSQFYESIRCLVCRGIISGYADGTFRPNNFVIRGQIAKMVSNSAGFNDPPGEQVYEDVPPSNTFYVWVQRLSWWGHMAGYPCGTVPQEPCNPPHNRPYFRAYTDASRGQISKLVANAAGFNEPPGPQYYADVPPASAFYDWVNRLTNRSIMGGYPCGGINPQNGDYEPCDPQNRPYFRPLNFVTRAQASKIVSNTFFPNCQTP